MTKKLIVEIPYPETKVVSAPVTWNIKHIGEFDDIYKIRLIGRVINWFINQEDGQYYIDQGHTFLTIMVDGLINRFDKKYIDDHYLRDEICHFLQSYRTGSGLELKEYTFSYDVACNGEKLGVVDSTHVYENQDELVKVLVYNFTNTFNKPMFEYRIVDSE